MTEGNKKPEELGKMETTTKNSSNATYSLEESLKEMQLIRSGRLKKKTWKELKEELKRKEK